MSTISLNSPSHTFAALAQGAIRMVAAVCYRVPDALFAWHERSRQRRALAMLTDHQLKDIGLSRADAALELSKPFWIA
jgi:uncharacterized protein YjiS (DUF1127 family)